MNVGPQGATCHSACPVLCHSESGPLSLSVHQCGSAGSASGQTACPVGPTLRQSRSRHGNTSPLCPGCPCLPLLPVRMNVSFLSTWCRTSLPFDFLSVLVVQGGAVCLSTPPSWFSSPFEILRYDCVDNGHCPVGLVMANMTMELLRHNISYLSVLTPFRGQAICLYPLS